MTGTIRERQCLVTGRRLPSDDMIRFVLGPDETIVPDVAGRLPGRGCWITADRKLLEDAVRGNRFARFAHRISPGVTMRLPQDLPELVARLLRKRCLDYLGMCNRAGELVSGFEKVRSALKTGLKAGESRVLVTAADGAPDGRRKLCQGLGLRTGASLKVESREMENRDSEGRENKTRGAETRGIEKLRVIDIFSRDDLSQALGLENAVHVALLPGGASKGFLREATRYAAFLGKMQDSDCKAD